MTRSIGLLARRVLMVVANTYATDTRVRREAKTLAHYGYDVNVLCWDRKGERRGAEVLDHCQVQNFRLGRSTVLVSSKLRYLMIAIIFQVVVVLWIARHAARAHNLVIHTHDFNTLIGSVFARQLLGSNVRLVYDCHELTPGVYQEWYGSLTSRLVGRLELTALRWVDAVVTANEAIYHHLTAHRKMRGIVLYCCPAIAEVPSVRRVDAKSRLGLRNSFVVLFSGRARQDYDLSLLLEAARYLKQNGLSGIRFVFTGPPETTSWLLSATMHENLQDLFDFRGWVPSEDLLLYYVASDLCFMITRDLGPNTRILTPIKLFESMACGVPVVVRDQTLAGQIVRHWGCGIVIDPASDSFMNRLMSLKDDTENLERMSASGRDAFRRAYNWDMMQGRLLQVYAMILSTWQSEGCSGRVSDKGKIDAKNTARRIWRGG